MKYFVSSFASCDVHLAEALRSVEVIRRDMVSALLEDGGLTPKTDGNAPQCALRRYSSVAPE